MADPEREEGGVEGAVGGVLDGALDEAVSGLLDGREPAAVVGGAVVEPPLVARARATSAAATRPPTAAPMTRPGLRRRVVGGKSICWLDVAPRPIGTMRSVSARPSWP